MSVQASNDRVRNSRRAVIRIGCAAVTLAIAVQPVLSQQPTRRPQVNADSARLVADLFFRAVADERWDVAAAMVDTMVIRQMVAERMRWRGQNERREMTIDDFMRDDPDKPRAVAEYELKRYRDRAAKVDYDPITFEFAGIKSLDELALLSAREATARYLQAQDERVMLRQMAIRSGCADSTLRWPVTLRRILGTVLSGDTVAFVLHTDGLMGVDAASPGMGLGPMIMELRLRRDGWQVRPSLGLLRRVNAGISSMSCDSKRRRSG